MAKQGTLTATRSYYTYRIEWSEAQSIANNSGTITCVHYLDCKGSLSIGGRNVTCTVGSDAKTFTSPSISFTGSKTITLGTTKHSVTHNEDGSKSVNISSSFGLLANINGNYIDYISINETVTLDTIPRQATIVTAPNFSDGENPTITYSNPAGNVVDKLEAGIFNDEGTQSYVPYREISKTGTSYTFTLTEGEKENLQRATQDGNSLTVRFYVKTTLADKTYLSYLTRTFSINDANPKITASVEDVNATTIALTGDKNKLIRYYSNAKATMSADAQKGAAIDEDMYIIRNGNDTGYGTTHTFENVESNLFTFIAEDSRGNIGDVTIDIPMVDYIKLTCYIANNRPDGEGNMDIACSGSYFNGSFGAIDNTLTVQYRYAEGSSSYSDWVDMSVAISGNSYYASASLDGLDYQKVYSFETRAIDKLMEVPSTAQNVKSKPLFHWGENDFVFEVPVKFRAGAEGVEESEGTKTFNGDVNIKGNLRLKGDGNYGNTLLFGDGTYCYISEPEDDVMHIKAKRVDFEANSVNVDGYPIPILDKGVWTPYLNSAVVSSYTTQYGWYSKMGQFVTVGFFVKATCKSGYTSTLISISGLPFTPMFSAAGGGMCSGAYVSAGFNFQCFVAETGEKITTRVQACNNTSQANLSTSSSGCWYPSGGGELTLSGTITFMANS